MGVIYGVNPTWAAQTDAGRIHIATKGIVQNGLLLNLDPGASTSYSGSGNTWTDLSTFKTNGTLNGVGYVLDNGGSLTFDGTDDYVSVSNTNLSHGTSNWTYSCWAYFGPSPLPTWYTLFENGNWTSSLIIRPQYGSQIGLYAMGKDFGSYTFTPTLQLWYHLNLIRNGSSVDFYMNGSYSQSLSFTGTEANIQPSSNLFIGKSQHNGSQIFKGRLSMVSIYNRALTAAEVRQNFNATRGRFNI